MIPGMLTSASRCGQDNDMDDFSYLRFWERVALIVALIALAVLIGCDGHDAEITAQLEAEAHDRKALRPKDILPLSHPLCTATMVTSVGGQIDHRGCYVPKGHIQEK